MRIGTEAVPGRPLALAAAGPLDRFPAWGAPRGAAPADPEAPCELDELPPEPPAATTIATTSAAAAARAATASRRRRRTRRRCSRRARRASLSIRPWGVAATCSGKTTSGRYGTQNETRSFIRLHLISCVR